MGWLLDTNIISQFAPDRNGRSRLSADVAQWTRLNQDRLYLSALSITEITSGIAKLRRVGSIDFAENLTNWLDRIADHYSDRIRPIDVETARIAGELSDRARANGNHPGLSDILIAATAITHGDGLLTDNIRHFEPLDLGIALVNPITQLPTS